MSTALDQFLAAIAEAGLTPPEFITTDGKLHRFSSDGRRCDKAGWYIFHTGDIPAGAFGCWRGGVSETWRADIGRELTAEEIAAHKRKLADAKRKRQEEEKKNRAKARTRAAKIWETAAAAPADHPYLAKKGVRPSRATPSLRRACCSSPRHFRRAAFAPVHRGRRRQELSLRRPGEPLPFHPGRAQRRN
jgi:putative DNA primase/helicase